MSENDVDKDKQESQQSGFNENQIYVNSSTAVELNKPPIWIWISVAGLLLVALLVIFVLPAIVSQYELPLERRARVGGGDEHGGFGDASHRARRGARSQ